MDRLTKRCKQATNDRMTKFRKFIEIALSEPKYHEKGKFSTQSTYDIYETNRLYPMADKLAEYEDLEDKGLLLRLPCKVGVSVYCIDRQIWIDEKGCKDCVYYCVDGSCCFEDDYPACTKVFETKFKFDMIEDFGKTVFLTREDAEKALADMGV